MERSQLGEGWIAACAAMTSAWARFIAPLHEKAYPCEGRGPRWGRPGVMNGILGCPVGRTQRGDE